MSATLKENTDELIREYAGSHEADVLLALQARIEELEAEKNYRDRVMTLANEYEAWDEIYWDKSLSFFLLCNDFFFWGTADAEDLPADSLDDFEQALKDSEVYGPLLYCARRRGMRPQGAYYQHIPEKDWPMFNACGPEREVDITNPKTTPPEKPQ